MVSRAGISVIIYLIIYISLILTPWISYQQIPTTDHQLQQAHREDSLPNSSCLVFHDVDSTNPEISTDADAIR